MTLPAPSLQLGDASVLIATRTLLRSSKLTDYLASQVTGLAGLSVTVTLPAPATVQIGTYDSWRQDVAPPALLVQFADRPTYMPDVAGNVYHVEARITVGILLTEADTSVITGGDQYMASVAYANAVANCCQRWLSGSAYGGAVGVYECVIGSTGAEPAPIDLTAGTYRVSDVTLIVRYQMAQEPPEVP